MLLFYCMWTMLSCHYCWIRLKPNHSLTHFEWYGAIYYKFSSIVLSHCKLLCSSVSVCFSWLNHKIGFFGFHRHMQTATTTNWVVWCHCFILPSKIYGSAYTKCTFSMISILIFRFQCLLLSTLYICVCFDVCMAIPLNYILSIPLFSFCCSHALRWQ